MVRDNAKSELEARIGLARDGMVNYFNAIPGFKASQSTTGAPFQAVVFVCHPYSGGKPQISGNEYGLDFKGRRDVCLKVTFEEEKKREAKKGEVRVLVNRHLNDLIHGTEDEAMRAVELHQRVREYVSGIAEFHEEHATRDAHTQLRYYLKPKHNP